MKKLTRILMMMLVLSVGTGITSCDEIEDMIDNPVVPEPTPTPTMTKTPATMMMTMTTKVMMTVTTAM